MAMTAKYEVGTRQVPGSYVQDISYPAVVRTVLLDGVEVSREYPGFEEIEKVDPSLIEKYQQAISTYLRKIADVLDSEKTPTETASAYLASVAMLAQDYTSNYDSMSKIPATYL